MKTRPAFLSASGAIWAAAAFAAIAAWTLVAGGGPFNAGGLNSAMTGGPLGGVTRHAEIGGRCGACHTAPWSRATMADRCMGCHADVLAQIQGHGGLHAGLLGGLSSPTCGNCHSEHRGPNGPLTANFDHSTVTFKLVGKHASVPCNDCHTKAGSIQDLRDTPQSCYACHAKDDNHKGAFGQECGQCHDPTGWAHASFDHSIFPVGHGGGGPSGCATCHPSGVTSYTCYGCHEHTPANIQARHRSVQAAQLDNCVACHSGGRGGGD